jgi:hypothetical protein
VAFSALLQFCWSFVSTGSGNVLHCVPLQPGELLLPCYSIPLPNFGW